MAHAERRIEREDELNSMRRSHVECRSCDFAEETTKQGTIMFSTHCFFHYLYALFASILIHIFPLICNCVFLVCSVI